jgi:hypothetical protein
MPGGYVVRDATGQALVYVYSRATEAEAMQAKVLAADEARQNAIKRRQAGAAVGRGGAAMNTRDDAKSDMNPCKRNPNPKNAGLGPVKLR